MSPQCGRSNKHSPQAFSHCPGRPEERIQFSTSPMVTFLSHQHRHGRGSRAQAIIPCWTVLHCDRIETRDISYPLDWLVLPSAPGHIPSGKEISNRLHLLGSLTATLGCTAPRFPVSPRSTVRPRESRSLWLMVSRTVVMLPRLSLLQKAHGPITQGPAASPTTSNMTTPVSRSSRASAPSL